MREADLYFMREALKEGRKGLGTTSPNPPVGAVVVQGRRIVGRGYHKKAGTPHAEVLALKAAGKAAYGATLYVTLEPCAHYGRTPPCTEAILAAGIKRVVIGCRDPNPKARGGADILRSRGLEVETGVLLAECATLCRFFLKGVKTGLPWVLAKAAMSLDGRIATRSGASKWITSEEARRVGHRLRALCDAILVGRGTVEADDPALTCRMVRGRDPVRIILDSYLRLPEEVKVFNSPGKTIVWTREDAPRAKEERLAKRGVEVWRLKPAPGGVDLKQGLSKAYEAGLLSILVEGGAAVHGSFFDQGLVDEIAFFYGPLVIGGKEAPSAIEGQGVLTLAEAPKLSSYCIRRLKGSFMVSGFLTDPVSLQ